ncbi:unnamed protein product, partial [Symbiodinium sp. CCMP2456]
MTIYDIMDVHEIVMKWMLEKAWRLLAAAAETAATATLSLVMAQLVALSLLLASYSCKRHPFGKARPVWMRIILFAAVISGTQAGFGDGAQSKCSKTGIPLPTDLELWMNGQATMREQLADAFERHVASMPLGHNSEVAPPPDFTVPIPDPPPPPPQQLQPHEHWINREEPATTHISFWICAPYYESMSLDVAMSFPLTINRVFEAIQNSAIDMPTDILDHPVAITPQPDEAYGSVLMIPAWIRMSDKTAVVLDGRHVGAGIFAAYFEGPLTKRALLQKIGMGMDEGISVFLFGSLQPMTDDQREPPSQGGLILFHRRGEVPEWATELDTRLADTTRWRPEVDHPQHLPGRHIEFQGEEQTFLHQLDRTVAPDPQRMADHAFGAAQGEVWIRAPTQRPMRMYARGKRVHSIIAVLGASRYPRDRTKVVFLDTRPIGLWPQWVAVPGDFLDPGAYAEGLQIPYIEGYSLIIKGGRRHRDGVRIRVLDGEVIEFLLKRSDEVTPTSSSFDPDSGDDEEDRNGDEGDDNDHPMPNSSDFSDPSPPEGDGPYGPPPPQPVNRSRSPRRRSGEPQGPHMDGNERGTTAVRLADYVHPPQFDISKENILFPGVQENIRTLMRPWSPEWLKPDLSQCDMKQTTKERLRETAHWADILGAQDPFSLHIYTDGSWLAPRKLGGYGVVLLLMTTTATALFGVLGEQTQGNSQSPWDFEGPPALKNEQLAIGAALLWLVQARTYFGPATVSLHYDCLAAGLPAKGEWPSTTDFSKRLRDLQRWADSILPSPICYQHVKAHVGEPFNEMADSIAKAAAVGATYAAPPHHVARKLLEEDFSWVAIMNSLSGAAAYPWAEGPSLSWRQEEHDWATTLSPQQLIPTTCTNYGKNEEAVVDFETVVVTWNVQGIGGQHRYIEEQLQHLQCGIALLQETKHPSSLCSSSRFLRLSTQADKHWGVAIWLSNTCGALRIAGKPITIKEADLYVCYESPRLLILSIAVGNAKVIVFSAHCPHSGNREEARQFLLHLQEELRPDKKQALIIGGIDLNGRIEINVPGVTGDLQHGEPDATGIEAAALCRDLGLWVPTTYSRYHRGQLATYRHPQATEHRIDYVLQGGAAEIQEASTTVRQDLDAGGAGDDHWPVSARFRGRLQPIKNTRRLWRPKFDVAKMLTVPGREIIAQAMNTYSPPPWTTHPDQHCQHLNDFIHSILDRHFVKEAEGPRASYITEEMWDLRQKKMNFKKRVRHRATLWQDLLHRALLQWRERSDYGIEALLAKQGILYQLASASIQLATRTLKKNIRQAKENFLRATAAEGGGTAADILGRIKRAGIGGSKSRQPFKPLPLLYAEAEQPVRSCEDRDSLWLHYFGEQEMGTILDTVDFLREPYKPILVDETVDWNLQILPSLGEIEQTLRGLSTRKASGLDAIPAEFLKAAPGPTAAAVHSLFFKAMATFQQPLHWRGGILYECWKRSGKQSDPAMYRSLFVSSMMGKTYHKLLRQKVQAEVNNSLHSFHLGARKGTPVCMPSLYILTHIRKTAARGLSSSVLFLDTHAAYYRIIRQLALGHLHSDTEVLTVFRRFGLEPSDVHDLMEQIQMGGMLKDARIPSAVRHAAKDLHHRAWFVSAHSSGSQLCCTTAGSRPGEAWADIVYAFVYSRVLYRIEEYARGEGLLDTIHVDASEGPFAEAGSGVPSEGGDATWADDSAWPISGETPSSLLRKMSRLCSLVLSSCYQHGMQPNLRPNKTSVIFALRGKGRVAARQKFFGQGKPVLKLHDLEKEIPVALQYKHLGGLVDCRNLMAPEAKRRLAMAAAAFDQAKDMLYLNNKISLQVRAALFAATVGATFHNLAQWIPHGQDWAILYGGYSRPLRRLLTRDFPGEALLHVPPALVHLLTGSWPLELVAKRARLSLLGSLARAAPELLWGALQEEQSWLRVVRADLQWLVQKDEDEWPALRPASWPEWRNIFLRAASWVKRRTSKKLKAEFIDLCEHYKVSLTIWAVYKRIENHIPGHSEVPTRWICRPCQRSFRTKGGLGAHFFKTHKRCAGYRAVVEGTTCQACGKAYWSTNRLLRHLRDSPKCVATLRSHGLLARNHVPGFGSKLWKKMEIEGYNPSVPQEVSTPLQPRESSDWDPVQKAAHAELCNVLLDRQLPVDADGILGLIRATVSKFPLYQDEINDIVDFVWTEAQEIGQELMAEFWSVELADAMAEAFRVFLSCEWPVDEQPKPDPQVGMTHWDIAAHMNEDKWASIWSAATGVHGTPSSCTFELSPCWETEWRGLSGVATVSVVNSHLWSWLPEVLRQVVQAALEGHSPRLKAFGFFGGLGIPAAFIALAE